MREGFTWSPAANVRMTDARPPKNEALLLGSERRTVSFAGDRDRRRLTWWCLTARALMFDAVGKSCERGKGAKGRRRIVERE